MKKSFLKNIILPVSLGSSLLVGMTPTIIAYANPTENPMESVQNDYSNLNNNEKLVAIEDNIEKLDNQIEKSMLKVEELKKNISDTEKELKSIDENIEITQSDLSKQKELMNDRLRVSYKKDFMNNSILSYMKILFSGDSFSDIISNVNSVAKMNEFDKALMSEIESKENSLKQDKAMANKKREQLISDKKEIEENLKNQEDLKVKQKELLDKTLKDISKENELKQVEEAKNKALAQQFPIINDNKNKINEKAIDVIKESYKYLGVPYLWGGTTPSGFDCSGYMQYIFNKVGVNLPRVSEEQQTVGTPVSNDDLQPGDLIFWGYPAHHVGMYIGNGQYIQAPHTGDVIKISTLGAYTNAKRVL